MTGDRNASLLAVADAVMDEHLGTFVDDADAIRLVWRDSRYGTKVRDAIYIALLNAQAAGVRAAETALPAPSSGWLPISEAPKDGTYVLLNFDNRPPTVARWLYGAWQAFDVLGFIGAPTHWQPLPLPPETSDHAR